MASRILIGCAGWALPKSAQAAFPGTGTHLQRYAAHFPAVEINSSFYRPHSARTYARWAQSVPETFRFAVKLPKTITHTHKLQQTENLLAAFLEQVQGLQEKLGCILIQLPPSLVFAAASAQVFFEQLRRIYAGGAALEPRHPTWFEQDANRLLQDMGIARVAADPPITQRFAPGGSAHLVYLRLHGQPRMYYSAYDDAALDRFAAHLRAAAQHSREAWCIFDNTASNAALENATALMRRLGREWEPSLSSPRMK